jgi:aspartate/methionine/tyrosine aminotransferase
VAGVAESPLVQIATIAESMADSVKLCYGESDMPTPAFICRALDEAARGGHTFYTHTAGYGELREAIAAQVHALHGVSYRGSEIMSTVGASMAIYVAIRCFVGPGDNAVVITPAYAIFTNGVRLSGGEAREVPLVADGSAMRLDIDRVRAAIDATTRMLIVNSPGNPTGWMMTAAEQRALVDLAAEHDLVLLADEVYERLIYTGAEVATSIAWAATGKTRVIVANSFSKTYNMTGWRLGWAQSDEATIRAMYKAAEFMTSNATAMVQRAGIVALRDGEPYVRELRAHYAARRAQVVAALRAIPGISLLEPEGAFYVLFRVDGMTDSAEYAERLVRETGVALAPGSAFGAGGEGYLRLCFAASEPAIADALARFTAFVRATAPRA